MSPASFWLIYAVTGIARNSTPAGSSGTQKLEPMAKSRGAKRGRKKKRIAVHIKEAQEKRTANALSLDDGKATQLLTTPVIGGRLRPSKRPRDTGDRPALLKDKVASLDSELVAQSPVQQLTFCLSSPRNRSRTTYSSTVCGVHLQQSGHHP